MRTFFLIAAIALVSSSVMAHNPLTAKFELDATLQEGAILNICVSQTGLHQALIKYFTNTDFIAVSRTEYKKLVVQYLKEHISIMAEDTLLNIGEGGIKLGSHQTDLKFLIENYPSEVSSLTVNIDAFKENENHHSVFWWKGKEGSAKVILSDKNKYTSSLSFDDNKRVLKGEIFNKFYLWFAFALVIPILVIGKKSLKLRTPKL